MKKRVEELTSGQRFMFAGNEFEKDEGAKDGNPEYLNCHWVKCNVPAGDEVPSGKQCYFKGISEVEVLP